MTIMKISKYLFPSFVALSLAAGFASCSEDDLGPTIFPEVSDDAEPGSYSYKLDTWLNRNFRDVYNLTYMYKMKDVEADMNYNLVPATFDRARDLALLTKYLWFDAYKEQVGEDFLKTYGPRIIHLIGSPAINPTQGTEILGLAEGGLKVSLFKVNEMVVENINMLNEYYFRTMHHEFGHILHQTKSYPVEFNEISKGLYDNSNWQNKNGGQMASLGFITPYASAATREDFAETIANFITRTDDQLSILMWAAGKGWTTGKEAADDGTPDTDSPYFCYYYYKSADDQAAERRTYVLTFADRPVINGTTDYRVGLQEGPNIDSRYRKNVFLTSAEDADKYVNDLNEALSNDERERLARSYGVANYAALTDDQKKTVDDAVAKMQPFLKSVPDEDKTDGAAVILQKQNIVRTWFKDVWGLDFDKLREIVQARQANKDEALSAMRAEVEAIQ